MTVEELIVMLQTFDPKHTVQVWNYNSPEGGAIYPINDVNLPEPDIEGLENLVFIDISTYEQHEPMGEFIGEI